MTALQLEHIADLDVEVDAPTIISASRRVIGIKGGVVTGPKLRGKILPGGADFQIIRSDQTIDLEARYVIQAESGALIYVENRGFRHGPPEAIERLQRGEYVDPALIYFRCVPRFETADPSLHWLTNHVFVGAAARFPDRVKLSFYRLL
jgi:hypothetical protein